MRIETRTIGREKNRVGVTVHMKTKKLGAGIEKGSSICAIETCFRGVGEKGGTGGSEWPFPIFS